MPLEMLQKITASLNDVTAVRPIGRVAKIAGGRVHVVGLPRTTRQGDGVVIRDAGVEKNGEIIAITTDGAEVLIDGATDGIAIGPPRKAWFRTATGNGICGSEYTSANCARSTRWSFCSSRWLANVVESCGIL